MFIPTPVWDAVTGDLSSESSRVYESAVSDPETQLSSSSLQYWADCGTQLAHTLGALVSIILAFRSNLSRLPPPPPPQALMKSARALPPSSAEPKVLDGDVDTVQGADPPDAERDAEGEVLGGSNGSAAESRSTAVQKAGGLIRRLALWMGLGKKPGSWEGEICRLIGQHQQWFLFDRPSRHDHWFMTLGRCKDGTNIDLFNSVLSDDTSHVHETIDNRNLDPDGSFETTADSNNGILPIVSPVLKSPAPSWSVSYRSHRWRKWLGRISEEGGEAMRAPYAQFLCRQWNQRARACGKDEKQVDAVEMYCIRRSIPHSTPPENWDLKWPLCTQRASEQEQPRPQSDSGNDEGGLTMNTAVADNDAEPSDPLQPFDRMKPVCLPTHVRRSALYETVHQPVLIAATLSTNGLMDSCFQSHRQHKVRLR